MLEALLSAIRSIWNNKVRSVLTVLGIVIGVASVTILVSLGEGLKEQVSGLIRGFGSNVIAVVGGNIGVDSGKSNTSQINPANFIAGDILTLEDVEAAKNIDNIKHVSPMALVSGNLKYEDNEAAPMLLGAYSNILQAFDVLKIEEGKMFENNNDGKVIILGTQVKKDLFGERNPIGQNVKLGVNEFKVIGFFQKPPGSGLASGEYDRMTLIPFDTATALNKNQVKINRILIRAEDNADVKKAKEDIYNAILEKHRGEKDFSVLTQDDILGLFDDFLGLATTLVSAIAAISLVVGGIGIMNIMLVTVTERTKEIGLRKAVGATKFDIALQFLVEAIMVTLIGGIIGLGISFAVKIVVATKTPLQPVITADVILTAIGVSVVVGVIFGLWPALRAAKKDPIEALHYE